MGCVPLLVMLWAKNDKIAFQRNRPKIMEIEKIEKNRKKSKTKIFFFNIKNGFWVLNDCLQPFGRSTGASGTNF